MALKKVYAVRLTVNFKKGNIAFLRKIAEKNERSLSWVVNQILSEYRKATGDKH